MDLSEFIVARSEQILKGWEEFARTLLPASQSMDIGELRDHADAMLKSIARDLKVPQTTLEQAEKSKGRADPAPDSYTAAKAHGAVRAGKGFTLAQMLSEFRALRASVLRLWAEAVVEGKAANIQDVTRFNEAIDQALAQSSQRYFHELEHSKALADAHLRLEHLYEIGELFASFEDVEQTFYPVVEIALRTLPLRSAILLEVEGGRSKMIIWPSEGQSPEQMRAAKEHADAAYSSLVAAASAEALEHGEQQRSTAHPRPAAIEVNLANRFVVIPLIVAHRPPFGALQLEGAQPLDKADLIFVNAIASQLAVALDRDRAWRRDITRRERAEEGRTNAEEGRTDAEARQATSERDRIVAEKGRTRAEKGRTSAEEGRTDAEARGATAERGRIMAESASEKYEALAGENARLYEQAQQAVRVREQLLAVVSHDLKNPLGTILMTAATLAQRGVPAQSIGRIQRAAERMLRLIEDLLDFASIEGGGFALKRRAEDPRSMIDEALAGFESVAQERRLKLTEDCVLPLPAVDCDRDRILQVLSNLLGNATKAAAEGGQISLRVEARGHEVLFTVADNGPGIREEDAKHLFERYWRGVDAQYKGAGLGLAIARGIVDAHGGRIWVESEPGRGATFFFTVPAADAAVASPGAEAVATTLPH